MFRLRVALQTMFWRFQPVKGPIASDAPIPHTNFQKVLYHLQPTIGGGMVKRGLICNCTGII